ncbi:MAG: hypothetical protein MZU91_02995 [Desulfosudis oleivorans]|nr:hypothetical protein [Desulfosudis oleivorans]
MIPEKNVYETRLALAAQGHAQGRRGQGLRALRRDGLLHRPSSCRRSTIKGHCRTSWPTPSWLLKKWTLHGSTSPCPRKASSSRMRSPPRPPSSSRPRPGMQMSPSQGPGHRVPRGEERARARPREYHHRGHQGQGPLRRQEGLRFGDHGQRPPRVQAVPSKTSSRKGHRTSWKRSWARSAAVVKVSADVNMDMVKNVQDTYDPEVHVVRSEELKNQYAGADKETPKGLPERRPTCPPAGEAPKPFPATGATGGRKRQSGTTRSAETRRSVSIPREMSND